MEIRYAKARLLPSKRHALTYDFHQEAVTPAMEAGICDHVWGLEEIAATVN